MHAILDYFDTDGLGGDLSPSVPSLFPSCRPLILSCENRIDLQGEDVSLLLSSPSPSLAVELGEKREPCSGPSLKNKETCKLMFNHTREKSEPLQKKIKSYQEHISLP